MLPLKTIDVAIGVAFLYLLLTFVASALVEMLSTARNWRAQMLHDAIENMLTQSQLLQVDEIYSSPLVLALSRNDAAKSWLDLVEPFGWRPAKGGTPPSYIPAATFSAAVLEGLINKPEASPDLSPDGMMELIRHTLQETWPVRDGTLIQPDALRSILETTIATQGSSIQAVRFAIEKWFNDTMDRASGWYKRRTQSCLLLIGLLVAFSGNVDTIAVARWLWQGDAARQTVIAAASDYVRTNPLPPIAPGGNDNAQSSPPKDLTKFATQIVNLDQHISSLQYPIGWPPSNLGCVWLLQYLLGGVITAIAVSMGSAFWFDALQGLIKMRGTGPKPSSR